jgi:heavy metal sensor kinase
MKTRSIPIKVRLTAWYFVIMALAMSALGGLALAAMEHSIRTTVEEQLAGRVGMAAKVVQAFPPAQSPERLAAALRQSLGPDSQEILVQIFDEEGGPVFQSSWLEGRTLLSAADAARTQKKRHPFFDAVMDGESFHGMSVTVAVGAHRYSIQVAQNMDDFDEAASRFRHLLLAIIPAVLIAASVGGYWMSRQALDPVDQITRAVQEISGKDLSTRLSVPDSGDELARLAETLNAMLERIGLALKQIAQFTADASHELRTPIALMRTRAELALRNPRSAEEHRETIAQLHAEIVRTSELVERLMLLARADSGASMVRYEGVELVQLVEEVLAQTSMLAEQKQLVVEARLGRTPVWVLGDAQFLRQLVVILIDNAVKYTPAPGKITVLLGRSNGSATLSVADTGIGIEALELENIFERFYRADRARSRETGGAGLGLAIGRWIAESHRGTLTAESQPGAGSVFRVCLPLIVPTGSRR